MTKKENEVTYKSAGVNIDAGEQAVELIKDYAKSTFIPGVMSGLGGFGGMFSLKELGMEDPVLVSGTDGVGTKLKLAFEMDVHDTVGIDAVAMCVNDVICCGAKPLFFLDYIATGRLEPGKTAEVIKGISEGCKMAGCALIGGEMAEMPGFYADGEYDIAGFCVGAVERSKIIDGSAIVSGDAVLGIPSTGLHSNGFSLVRKIVEVAGLKLGDNVPELGGTLGRALLTPTMIYAKQALALIANYSVHGLANITGGGLEGNTIRVVPKGLTLEIDWSAWKRPAVFEFLQKAANVAEEEIRRVFNLGVGMSIIMPEADAEKALASPDGAGIGLFRIGRIK